MSRTKSTLTQAEMDRSVKAAKKVGASWVEFRRDGTIFIAMTGAPPVALDDLDKELAEFEASHGQG